MSVKKLKLHFGKISAIMIAVFAVLLTVDLVLKAVEESYHWNFTVIPGLIKVTCCVRNPGAAFSFLAEAEWGQAFLIAITIIMLIVLFAGFLFLPERFVVLKLSIAMITSGAVGNLVDRIAFGNVRDFVWVNMLGNWACCNFADFWIVFGVIIAVVDMLFLNEWAIFPLTKSAKAAQAAAEARQNQTQDASETQPQESQAEDGKEDR